MLAAGKGTRMGSDLPKVLHPFRGEPLVVHPLRAALDVGAAPVVVVVGHGEALVRAAVAAGLPSADARFALQAQQHGTGHAVACALTQMDDVHGPVLILSGDVPLVRSSTLWRLVDACARSPAALALGVFTPDDPTGYGRILRDGGGAVVGIREHRDASPAEREIRECNAGLYCVDADALRDVLPRVRRDNAQGEIYLTDIVAPRAAHGTVAAVAIAPLEAAGVNTPEELAALELAELD